MRDDETSPGLKDEAWFRAHPNQQFRLTRATTSYLRAADVGFKSDDGGAWVKMVRIGFWRPLGLPFGFHMVVVPIHVTDELIEFFNSASDGTLTRLFDYRMAELHSFWDQDTAAGRQRPLYAGGGRGA
jgi:hypothetical protein